MRFANALLVVGLALVLVVAVLLVRTPTGGTDMTFASVFSVVEAPESTPDLELPDIERPRTVYDISLHDPEDLHLLLGRLEALSRQPNPQSRLPEISLVLHGPELNLFAIGNYADHRQLVDLAAKLDAFQLIEVKACRTMMRELKLEPEDMPAFIEIVPYGPDEVERLVGEGYLKM